MSERGRGYTPRGRGKRFRGGGQNNSNNESARGKSEPGTSTRKFNPFWRARAPGRSWNANASLVAPVAVHIGEAIEDLPQQMETEDSQIEETQQKSVNIFLDNLGSEEFPLWRLYFPYLEYEAGLPVVGFIKAFEKTFDEMKLKLDDILKKSCIKLSYETLLKNTKLIQSFPTFVHEMKENPEQTLSAAGIALQQVMRRHGLMTALTTKILRVQLVDFKPILPMQEAFQKENVETMVSVRGTVMRVDDMEVRDVWQVYKCGACDKLQLVFQPNGNVTVPLHCKGGCRAKNQFEYERDSPLRVYEPVQQLRLQESVHTSQRPGNTHVNYINSVVRHHLVDLVNPGDDIILTGIVRITKEVKFKQAETIKQYIDVVHVQSITNCLTVQRSYFTALDLSAIKKIQEEPSVFRLLVNSLNPKIYGHELVKAGLVLSLFGGASMDPLGTSRCNIHVLMVGDPGMGKSELLNSCATVAPKAIYAVSTNLTGAGLTAGLKRVGERFAIEAGALILADGGICCIDEIDKKVSMHNDLLDAMERQKISIAKACNRVNLSARTTIIAAGNPIGNVYDKEKSISENLRIGPALLSRFDLVFIMERKSGRHGLALAAFRDNPLNVAPAPTSNTLEKFLQLQRGEDMDHLPHILFQNYVGYARNKCFPVMPENVSNMLEEFYLELRQLQASQNFSITIRQLNALQRLATARARVDLADTVTVQHAKEIIELTRYSLFSVLEDETGQIDLSRGIQGSGLSQRGKKMQFFTMLKSAARSSNKDTFTMADIKKIAANLQLDNVHNVIDSLNINGFLLMVRHGDSTAYKINSTV